MERSLPDELTRSIGRRQDATVRPPRPVLLLLVFGVFLVIVGITATGLVLLTTAHVTTNVLNQAVAADGRIVRGFVGDHLRPEDVATEGLGTARAAELTTALATLVGPGGFARVELRRPDGTLLLDDVGASGGNVPPSTDWRSAAEGRVAAAIVGTAESEVAGTPIPTPDLLREYFPLGPRGPRRGDRGAVAGRDARRRGARRCAPRHPRAHDERRPVHRARPVPRVPIGASPAHAPDRGAGRSEPARPLDRAPEPRHRGGAARDVHRAPADGRRRHRGRAARHRQPGQPERHPRPRDRRSGHPHRRGPARATAARTL